MSGFLLDTSFLITLVDASRDHHLVAKAYYREALQRGVPLYLSTIVVSEFQAGQAIDALPLQNFILLPFNFDHAVQAGLMFRFLRDSSAQTQGQRGAVKEDLKLLSQAQCDGIPFLLTADEQTLCRYARRLMDAGLSKVRPVTLAAGFDLAWFNHGQASLPGT